MWMWPNLTSPLTTSKPIHFDCNEKSVQDILKMFSFSVPWKKDKVIKLNSELFMQSKRQSRCKLTKN